MKNKVFNLLVLTAISLVITLIAGSYYVSAEQQTLGTFKQNDCINLIQSCSNCTYVNISSVNYPSGSEALGQVEMVKSGTSYTYIFCNTEENGRYIVNGFGDLDGSVSVWTYDFIVNSNGDENNSWIYVILLIVGGIIALGFSIKDGWFVVLGGLSLIVLGLYFYTNGIAGVNEDFLIITIALITGGVGAYLAINATLEIIRENLNQV